MIDLKERLIKRIQETSDASVLNEVYRLLELDFDDPEVYQLSNEQRTAVKEAQQQVARGEYLTNEQSNQAVEQWLKEK